MFVIKGDFHSFWFLIKIDFEILHTIWVLEKGTEPSDPKLTFEMEIDFSLLLMVVPIDEYRMMDWIYSCLFLLDSHAGIVRHPCKTKGPIIYFMEGRPPLKYMNGCFTSLISLELAAHPTNVLNQALLECSWLQQLKCSWPKSQRWYFPAEGRDLSNGMCDWFWKVAMARTKAWESFDKRLDVWKALACPSVARWPMLNFWIYKYPKQFSLLFFVPAFCQQIWKDLLVSLSLVSPGVLFFLGSLFH